MCDWQFKVELIFCTVKWHPKKRTSSCRTEQIVRLGAAIPANNMAAIAEGYMGISSVTIKNKKYENKDDSEAFNREIIRHWANKNPENQVKVSLKIWLPPASEGWGNVLFSQAVCSHLGGCTPFRSRCGGTPPIHGRYSMASVGTPQPG